MSKNNKGILLQIWLIVKQVFGIVFMIVAWIFHLIYELAHLSDENYQRKKQIQAQYDMKREWLERARAEDILNDWRLKAAGLRPESREEAIIVDAPNNSTSFTYIDHYSPSANGKRFGKREVKPIQAVRPFLAQLLPTLLRKEPAIAISIAKSLGYNFITGKRGIF